VGENLSDLGEFEVIRRLLARIPTSDLIVGPGDDAAAIATGPQTLATADLLIEGRHFDLAFSTPGDVGFKALAVNASDIAAMGGRPRYALLSVGAPAATSIAVLEALYDGVAEAARAFGVTLAGGDTVGADQIVVSVAMLGEPGAGGVVRRSGARPGDLLCVTGELGAASAGLSLLRAAGADAEARELIDRFPHLIEAHRRGRARIREGELIASAGARAMIDVSDGLLADAGHLCERSGVGVLVDAHAVPRAPGVDEIEQWSGAPGLALIGGDDYELCFAMGAEAVDDATRAIAPTGLTVVGRFIEGSGVELTGAVPPPARGWDGFR
jgi:thiamine-monophosphate kinase